MNEIRYLIREEIERYNRDNLLREFFPYERSDFKDRVESRIPIILIHWLFIRYFKIKNENVRTFQHWKDELTAQFYYLVRLKIKKNNSYENILKAIKQAWEEGEFNSSAYDIAFAFKRKFNEENIDINSNEFNSAIEQWVEESKYIIEIFANANLKNANEYINNL